MRSGTGNGARGAGWASLARVGLGVLAVCLAAGSARGDGLTLVEQLHELREGSLRVVLERARIGGASGRELFVIRADLPPDARFEVLAGDAPAALQKFLPEGALVAINGAFYDTDGRPLGLVVRRGETLRRLRKGGGSGVLLHGEQGFRIVHRDRVPEQGVRDALQSIDRLVADGRSVVEEAASPSLDARSAVAAFADASARFYSIFAREAVASERCDESDCIFVLNDRSTHTGVSLRELAEFLVTDGAVAALNLDGGFSTSFEARLGGRLLRVVAFRGTINALAARP